MNKNSQYKQLVAVYGSLLKGLSNHRVLRDSMMLGTDTINGFKMYNLGSFPAIIPGDGAIHIEIYEVIDPEIMLNLDYLEGHPRFYKREKVDTIYGESWIYVLNMNGRVPLSDSKLVKNGNWKEHYKTEIEWKREH